MTGTYAPARSTNGLAIAAFVLSLVGLPFLSIPFGFVALHQIKHRREDGRGLAIAGLVISLVEIIVILVLIFIGIWELQAWATTAPAV